MSTEESTIPYGYCQCGCGEEAPQYKKSRTSRGVVKGDYAKYIPGHNFKSQVEYLVEDRGYITPCWVWQRTLHWGGYGKKRYKGKMCRAHRVYYEMLVGPIPEGLQLDHLCRVRACVNPEHLEPVTRLENHLRGERVKLTMALAEEIRRLYATGEYTHGELGELFGVRSAVIGAAVRYETWVPDR